MEPVTDWIRLWRELVEAHERRRDRTRGKRDPDIWRAKARAYDEAVKRRWARPDSSRTFIAAQLDACPGATVLDIGAGTGAWTVFLARHAHQVTAVDPSPTMLAILRHNLATESIANVEIVQGRWPEVNAPVHDFALCSHAMYGVADFPAFIRRMEAVTRRRCYLLLRAPTPDGVMAEAAGRVWGQPYDSPNFQVAYNGLLQMGVFAHVLMEDTGLWSPWTHPSRKEALAEVKFRLGLPEHSEHDKFLADLLRRKLIYQEGRYVWPRGVRSALVYWDVGGTT